MKMFSEAAVRSVGSQSEIPTLKLGLRRAIVGGYHEFSLTRRLTGNVSIKSHVGRQSKYQKVASFLSGIPRSATICDLGSSSGFNGFSALLDGFEDVTMVDHDTEYLEIAARLAKWAGLKPKLVESTIDDYRQPADVVFAFALIHWLFSATENYLSLDKIIGKLSALTSDVLFVEWVDPRDSAFSVGNHLASAGARAVNYSRKNFVAALEDYFTSFAPVAYVTETREIWRATRS